MIENIPIKLFLMNISEVKLSVQCVTKYIYIYYPRLSFRLTAPQVLTNVLRTDVYKLDKFLEYVILKPFKNTRNSHKSTQWAQGICKLLSFPKLCYYVRAIKGQTQKINYNATRV